MEMMEQQVGTNKGGPSLTRAGKKVELTNSKKGTKKSTVPDQEGSEKTVEATENIPKLAIARPAENRLMTEPTVAITKPEKEKEMPKEKLSDESHLVKFALGDDDDFDDDDVFNATERKLAELNASSSSLQSVSSTSSLYSLAKTQETARNISKLVRPRPMSKSVSVGLLSLDTSKPGGTTDNSRIPMRLPPGKAYQRSASVAGMTELSTLHENQRKMSKIPLFMKPDGSIVVIKKPIGELLPKHTPEERAELACQPAPHDPHFKKSTQTMGLRPIPMLAEKVKVPEILHHETAEGMTLVLAVPKRRDAQSVARATASKSGRDTYVTAPYGETYILSARCPTTGIDRYIKFIV